MTTRFLFFVAASFSVMAGTAQQNDTLTAKNEMPQVNVVAQRDRLLSKVPGSVSVIKFKDIQTLAPLSGNDVVKRVPGINVVDEEGAGLRTILA
jgi:outer membrane receptor for Fe3+-dicitrate